MCDDNGDFGSDLRGDFAPGQKDTPQIRESTLSLVFDSLQAEGGSYWTLFSIGKYEEEKAFSKKSNTRQEEMPRYYAPEEIFLDKLGKDAGWGADYLCVAANCSSKSN